MDSFPPTPRTQVKRLPKRGVYDKAQVHAILDEGFLCHVGFSVEGQTYVIPTGYVRVDDRIYIHGSPASRMLGALKDAIDVCLTVTLLDGLVLARSAFHHSMNYRSVVVLGRAQFVADPAEKMEAMRAFVNHVVPGRWDEARQPTAKELQGTHVLALRLEEVSAKVRTGPPIDDEGGLHAAGLGGRRAPAPATRPTHRRSAAHSGSPDFRYRAPAAILIL